MKTAVRQILLSTEPINPSPNSLFPPAPTWQPVNAGVSSDGVVSEGANGVHALFRVGGLTPLQDNIPYRWTVWIRPLNRRFCYLTIAPGAGGTRFVTLWGLDGQGLLETRQVGATIANVSTSYKKIRSDIYKLVFNFTITSNASNQAPIVGVVDTFPPIYTGTFDVTFQGLNQRSIQVIANECVPV